MSSHLYNEVRKFVHPAIAEHPDLLEECTNDVRHLFSIHDSSDELYSKVVERVMFLPLPISLCGVVSQNIVWVVASSLHAAYLRDKPLDMGLMFAIDMPNEPLACSPFPDTPDGSLPCGERLCTRIDDLITSLDKLVASS